MGELLTTHIPTGKNHAELLTKFLHRRKHRYHVSNLLYNIYDDHIQEDNRGVSHFEGKLWVLSQWTTLHTRGDWKIWSYFYGRIPILCRLNLVTTEQITHCKMEVIWPRKNTVEILSTKFCIVEIRSMEGCIYTGPLKHGWTPWKYNLRKAVDLRDHLNTEEHRGSKINGSL